MKRVKDIEDVVIDIDDMEAEEISSIHPSTDSEDVTNDDIKIEDDDIKIEESETHDEQWEQYMSQLSAKRDKKSKKVFCQIDSELAYTLDECRISDNSRSDMINAIVRCFIKNNLHRLSEHRQIRKTLLDQ